jgi:putative ABC transport system permease protein
MIRNYLKIAFRNLWRHKSFSLINIVGLAIGLTASVLIFMYVKFELSYDDFNTKADQIYRVNTDLITSNEAMKWSISTAPMGPALKADFPEVLEFTRVFRSNVLVKVKDQLFKERRMLFAEPSLFKIFDFQLVKGSAEQALKNPYSVVLTESTAKKYFGSADPMGKTLVLDNKYPVTVTGVVKEAPANSQLKFDLLYSVSSLDKEYPGRLSQWDNFGNFTFLLLKRGTNASLLQAKMPAFLRNHISEADKKQGMNYALFLEPLKETYMSARTIDGGNVKNVYIFSVIGLFILLIAAINFINLTTARATERAKEVGVRKVIGAGRNQLVWQFLGESIMICLISFVFAALLISLLLPMFNQIAGKEICNNIFEHGYIGLVLLIALVIGLLAGVYPALVLSGFKPVVVLKGRFTTSAKGTLLRKALVVTQFAISIVLIVGTLVVYKQLNYMRNQALGFNKDQMLTIKFGNDETVIKNYQSIENELKAVPNVLSITMSQGLPGFDSPNAHSELENRQGNMQSVNMNLYEVDYNFIPAYGMKVIAGRAFSTAFGTDSTKAIVINEAAVKVLGYASANDAIGKRFVQWGRDGKIIGVVKNFNYRSLQENVEPLNMRLNTPHAETFSLKIATKDIPATIAALATKWKVLVPQQPFSYDFVDQNFNKQYANEERFGTLFLYFAALAIFISCLGLLGLVAYSTVQRTREIGIRKVLGASVMGIVSMLSKEFLALVVVALLIAFPLAWFGMNTWLHDFAYRINISWVVFVAAGAISMLIAFTTVCFQSIKAALANPVKSLKSE